MVWLHGLLKRRRARSFERRQRERRKTYIPSQSVFKPLSLGVGILNWMILGRVRSWNFAQTQAETDMVVTISVLKRKTARYFERRKELWRSDIKWVRPERSQDICMRCPHLSIQAKTDIPVAVVSFGEKESRVICEKREPHRLRNFGRKYLRTYDREYDFWANRQK